MARRPELGAGPKRGEPIHTRVDMRGRAAALATATYTAPEPQIDSYTVSKMAFIYGAGGTTTQ